MAVIGKTSFVLVEFVTGERFHRVPIAEVPPGGLVRDVVVGEQYGKDIIAGTLRALSDTVIGEQYGLNLRAQIPTVSWDIVIREANTRVPYLLGDVVVSAIEPIKPLVQAGLVVEEVMRDRPKVHPSTVLSDMIAGSVMLETLQARTPGEEPRSPMWAYTLRMEVVEYRLTRPPSDFRSPMFTHTLRELVVRSRDLFVPRVSEVASAALRMQATARRVTTAPPVVRSMIDIGSTRELVLRSRISVVTLIDDQAGSLHMQTVQARPAGAPVSPIDVGTQAQLILMQRVVSAATDNIVGALHSLATVRRDVEEPRSPVDAATLAMQALTMRVPTAPFGVIDTGSVNALAVTVRVTAPPGQMGAWAIGQLYQLRAAVRITPPAWAVTQVRVGSLRVTYTMGRTTVPPAEVIDPNIGRHVAQLQSLSVMHRVTLPPDTVLGAMRYAYGVHAVAVARDLLFPIPPTEPIDPVFVNVRNLAAQVLARDTEEWEPVSVLTVENVQSVAALVDEEEWADPTVPNSSAEVFQAGQAVALGDEDFPPGDAAQSDVRAILAFESPVVEDEDFPPGDQAQSVGTVIAAFEHAAMGDESFPPGGMAQSVLRVTEVVEALARRDLAISGVLPSSPAGVLSLGEVVVLRDLAMNYLPLRARGPRPNVTVIRS